MKPINFIFAIIFLFIGCKSNGPTEPTKPAPISDERKILNAKAFDTTAVNIILSWYQNNPCKAIRDIPDDNHAFYTDFNDTARTMIKNSLDSLNYHIWGQYHSAWIGEAQDSASVRITIYLDGL